MPRDKRQQAMANGLDCRRCLLGQCLDSGRAPAATPQRKYRSTRHHPGVGVHDAEDRPQQQLEGNSALSGNFLQRRQIGRQRRKNRRQRRDCRYHHQARRIRVSASNALHTDRCSRSCIPESSCLAARWFTETAANAAATGKSLAQCTAFRSRSQLSTGDQIRGRAWLRRAHSSTFRCGRLKSSAGTSAPAATSSHPAYSCARRAPTPPVGINREGCRSGSARDIPPFRRERWPIVTRTSV